MMKKSPARSLSKGLSKAGLGMRKSTAAARTTGKPSQNRGLAGPYAQELKKAYKDMQAQNERRVATSRPQKPKGPPLTGLSAKQRQQIDAFNKMQSGVTQPARQTNQLSAAQRLAKQQAQNNARQQTPQFIRSKGPGGMTLITKAPTKNAYAGALTKRRKV